MQTTHDQLNQFHQFALARLDSAPETTTLEELFDQWRLTCPTQQERDDNVSAIAASLRDFDNGERGVKAEQFATDFRSRNGI